MNNQEKVERREARVEASHLILAESSLGRVMWMEISPLCLDSSSRFYLITHSLKSSRL